LEAFTILIYYSRQRPTLESSSELSLQTDQRALVPKS